VCWAITASGWTFELIRLKIPAVKQAVIHSWMGKILREKEQNEVTGSVYFSLGCTLAISLFPPVTALPAPYLPLPPACSDNRL